MLKICNRCNIEKEYKFFYKRNDTKDGYRSECKECGKLKIDKEKQKEYNKLYNEVNSDIISKNKKIKYRENREKYLYDKKEYYLNNKEIIKEYKKKYRIENKEKIREKNRIYCNNRVKTDTLYALKRTIMSSIKNSFHNKNMEKNNRCEEILGCSILEFKIYLESKFEDWMNWNNKGLYNSQLNFGWDIDHIIPVSSAITYDDIVRLNHYTNLQPLCSYTNRYIKCDNLK
jgi:hypothetical protein